MKRLPGRLSLAAGMALSLLLAACAAREPASETLPSDPLVAGFVEPPMSARPRVWWHWMKGNVSRDGIRKDLEWMKRAGIGGLQNFDAALGTPPIVEPLLIYMTPEWNDAFRYAVGLADELGLEFAIAGSPGWSETGGPWVPPEDGMKKLVWSETIVTAGQRFTDVLAPPPTVTGPFQNMAIKSEAQHYADIAVLAVPDESRVLPLPKITASDGQTIDATLMSDGDPTTAVTVRTGTTEAPGSIMLRYDAPQTICSATMFIRGMATMFTEPLILPRLEAKEGGRWRPLADLPAGMVPTTVSFAPVTAREFRLVFNDNTRVSTAPPQSPPAPGAQSGALSTGRPGSARVVELSLSADARIDQFEVKAGFGTVPDYYAIGTPTGADLAGVRPDQVIDLTARMDADGRLDWTPPAGRWKLLRLGYSLTGTKNHPATEAATGLEVDKYDAGAVRRYMETYLGLYREALGDPALMGARGLNALLLDSTEVGASNWTPSLIEHFERLRGYDPRPWLPALTGVIVGSRSQSDAFLYDFRRTLAELHASQHYAEIAKIARAHGLTLYGEALEAGRPTLGDDMAMRAPVDVPMAALWTYPREQGPPYARIADLKGASSVAHVYGQNLAAAESLTSVGWPWAHAPADLKHVIDFEFANGINRPVIHTSVHQPVDDKQPGLSLAIFGQFFTRHETWAEMARPWIDYIARSSFLLQQGRNIADVAYFHGEESPLTSLFALGPLTGLPTRYAYDFVNADALLTQLSVENGELIAKSGARYRVLYLGGSSQRMTLPVLRQLHALVQAGATVVGLAPQDSPSLADDADEFARHLSALWSGAPVTTLGQGRVIATQDIETALASIGVAPDFDYDKPQPDSELLFVHRRLADDTEIYFINNRRNRAERIDARFRVAGRAPEIWRAEDGSMTPVSYRSDGGITTVPLALAAEDALFVVFRKPASSASAQIAQTTFTPVADIDGAWALSFQPDRGAPATAQLDALVSLSEHADPGIRYFSGVTTYRKAFTLPEGIEAGAPLQLDLGAVGDLAEVHVNDVLVGTAWKPPYRVDIGGAVRAGENRLEVRVANLWVNRLIGDAQPDAEKVAYTAIKPYKPDAPLRPAGLLGPVQLLAPVSMGAALPRIGQYGRWLTDPQGRVVMIRGGNMIQLARDAHLAGTGAGKDRWHADTPRLTADAGFNGTRLIVFMDRVSPEPGRIDHAYLDAAAETVAAYAAQGIWTLIDFHQDEYGPEVGVRGLPAWMTLSGGLVRDRSLKFPNGYFRDRAVQAAFDNFWANAQTAGGIGVQDAYVAAVAELARRFADEPAVFGIDLMNEPHAGTPCSEPDPAKWAGCDLLERERLGPFHARAGRAVGAAAPRTILFVEPFMLQGALGVPINTPMPATKLRGLSYHNYGPFRPIREQVSIAALTHAQRQGAAIINTEWGFSNDAGDLAAQAQDFDDRLIPWLAWARGPFEALVNPAAVAEPAINREAVLRAYARPYPAATAGTPVALSFDADAGTLEYRWSTTGPDGADRSALTTEIGMPPPSFPQGYRASVEGGRIVSVPDAPMLLVRAEPGAHEVVVRATRIGELAPVSRPPTAAVPGARLGLDSLVGDLMRDPGARAILEKYLPTLMLSDQIGLASQISLRSMQPYLPEMSEAVMKQLEAELAALPER